VAALVLVHTLCAASGTVYVTDEQLEDTLSFDDLPADFGPPLPVEGIVGDLVVADPIDACSEIEAPSLSYWVALVMRTEGWQNCTFVSKVYTAQKAGASAVIVFDDKPHNGLHEMGSDGPNSVSIPSVFVTYETGIDIQSIIDSSKPKPVKVLLKPNLRSTAWSVLAASFTAMLGISATLATFLFVRRLQLRRQRVQAEPTVQEAPRTMNASDVRRLPLKLYSGPNSADSCSICLEDFEEGEKLRVLPCGHQFHSDCIEQWLTTRPSPVCPLCKQSPLDLPTTGRTLQVQPAATEHTPLLQNVDEGGENAGVSSEDEGSHAVSIPVDETSALVTTDEPDDDTGANETEEVP